MPFMSYENQYHLLDITDVSLIGLSLTYIISLTGMFQYVVRQSVEVENLVSKYVMNSYI